MFYPYNIAHFLCEQAEKQGSACALMVPLATKKNENVAYYTESFRDLNKNVDATAYYLKQQGVLPGKKILLMLQPGVHLVHVTFALFKLGAVPIIIDPGMGLKSYLKTIRNTHVDFLIANTKGWILSFIFFKCFFAIKKRISIGYHFKEKIKYYYEKKNFPVYPSKINDLAAILFTSGSTGAPKGVCYEHAHFLAQLQLIQSTYNIQKGEVDLPMLAIFALFNPALGMCTVIPDMNPSKPIQVDPQKIVQAITQNKVTNSFGSPALWTKIADYCKNNNIQLPSLKRVLIAGAPVGLGLLRNMQAIAPQAQLHTPYGATECLPVTTISSQEILTVSQIKDQKHKGTCVRTPLYPIRVKIIASVDQEIKNIQEAIVLPPYTIGEIITSGPVVTKNYYQLPHADKLSKIQDSDCIWHRMGDLGYLDDQNRLWFCGRKIETVYTPKGPMYTELCEKIFNQHPYVHRSALIAIGSNPTAQPAIVIEPKKEYFPKNEKTKDIFIKQLKDLAFCDTITRDIGLFFFEKSLPVDVRHNAKIHRLKLTQIINNKLLKN